MLEVLPAAAEHLIDLLEVAAGQQIGDRAIGGQLIQEIPMRGQRVVIDRQRPGDHRSERLDGLVPVRALNELQRPQGTPRLFIRRRRLTGHAG